MLNLRTKRANERSKICTRSWREIALFIKNKKMRKHSCLILKFLYTFSAHKMSKKYGKKSETLQ